jgi:hypothetical protein
MGKQQEFGQFSGETLLMKRLKIFIIFHASINIEYYQKEILPYIVFVNVNPANDYIKDKFKDLTIIQLNEFKKYTKLGNQYAEAEVLYNVNQNSYLTENLDYIGFLHHDMDISKVRIDQLMKICKEERVISFETHTIRDDYNNQFLMDDSKPNLWQGFGKSCYDTILSDINEYTGGSIEISNIKHKKTALCCAFMMSLPDYKKMMNFIGKIIESKKLDKYDSKKQFRMQGGLLERYIGTWIAINTNDVYPISIIHTFHQTNKAISKNKNFKKLLDRLKLKAIKAIKSI